MTTLGSPLSRDEMNDLYLGVLYENESMSLDECSKLFETIDVFLKFENKFLHPIYDLEEITEYLLSKRWIIRTKNSRKITMIPSANPDKPSEKDIEKRMRGFCGQPYSAIKEFLSDVKKYRVSDGNSKFISDLAIASRAFKLCAHSGMERDFVEPYLTNHGIERNRVSDVLAYFKKYLSIMGTVSLDFFT